MPLLRDRRVVPAAIVLLAVGALLTFTLTRGESDDPARLARPRPLPAAVPSVDRVARTLSQLGRGPAGSAPVLLTRWHYRGDPSDTGVRRGWADGTFAGRAVSVPYSPNARDVTGPGATRAYAGSVGWFARTIDVPIAGEYAVSFASAHHEATVFVDGREVRRHVGAYEPFAARTTLARGRHTVAVRVDWRDPGRQAATGYGRGWFNFGGLNRSVTLTRLAASEIGALTVLTRLVGGGARVRVTARVRNRGPVARRLTPRGSLERAGTQLPIAFTPVRVPAGESRTVAATVRVDDPGLWSPFHPRRYTLTVAVPGESRLQQAIGLREIRWGPSGLRLNGEPLRLRGVALPPDTVGHGDAMTDADEARTVRELVSTGANATRSQLPLSQSMLARLDAAGILVWQELGPWETPAGFHARTVAGARDRALRTAELEQAHPSILTWTLTNEAFGVGRPRQVKYVQQTAAALHRGDPSRPVAVDLWGRHLTKVDGPMFHAVDAIGVTDYTGWYEGLGLDAAGQAALAADRLAGLRALFPDKPIVVAELGAAGTRRIAAGSAFGGLAFQAELLGRRLKALNDLADISGAIVWLLRDHALRPDFRGGSVLKLRPGLDLTQGLNEKGLFDYRGRPKPALAAVRAAFGR